MAEQTFYVIQAWRIRRVFAVVLGLAAATGGVAGAVQGQGALWWLFAAIMLGLAGYNLCGLVRQPWVVRLADETVEIRRATGRVIRFGRKEIAGYRLTPGERIGALEVTGAPGEAPRTVPIPIQLIGRSATEVLAGHVSRFLAEHQ